MIYADIIFVETLNFDNFFKYLAGCAEKKYNNKQKEYILFYMLEYKTYYNAKTSSCIPD